jgi:hypothetical protein
MVWEAQSATNLDGLDWDFEESMAGKVMGFMQNKLGFFGLEDMCAPNGANGCKELVLIRADFTVNSGNWVKHLY